MNDYFIEEIIQDLRKPRLICVCDNFDMGNTPEREYDMDFVRCMNCKGWMSAQRLVEMDYERT